MFLNRELLHWGPLKLLDHRAMRRQAAEALAQIGVDVASVETEVGTLSGGQRQAIAVARAVHSNARILLLDEPLAAMGAREAQRIIGLIERLKARVGHGDDADVRLDGAEGVVRGLGLGRRERVEERRLPDVRQPDDSDG